MAVTIFHKVINNKVTIINRNPNKEEKQKQKRLNAKLRLNRHTRSETKVYD